MQQNSHPRTTVWKVTKYESTLLKTIPGLPVGKPNIGARVSHPEFVRGSGPTAGVYEAKLRSEA